MNIDRNIKKRSDAEALLKLATFSVEDEKKGRVSLSEDVKKRLLARAQKS